MFENNQRQEDGATVGEHIEAAKASPFAVALIKEQELLQEEI